VINPFCTVVVPAGVTLEQLRKTLVKWLEANPAELHIPAQHLYFKMVLVEFVLPQRMPGPKPAKTPKKTLEL
jgi:hypothetical protein